MLLLLLMLSGLLKRETRSRRHKAVGQRPSDEWPQGMEIWFQGLPFSLYPYRKWDLPARYFPLIYWPHSLHYWFFVFVCGIDTVPIATKRSQKLISKILTISDVGSNPKTSLIWWEPVIYSIVFRSPHLYFYNGTRT